MHLFELYLVEVKDYINEQGNCEIAHHQAVLFEYYRLLQVMHVCVKELRQLVWLE